MIEVEFLEFKPIANDDSFVVTLKPLGFIDYERIQMDMGEDEPSGGPIIPETKKTKFEKNLKFVRSMFKASIVKIEGFKLNGKMNESPDDLIDYGPKDPVTAIVMKISEISKAKDSEIKN